MWGLDPLSWVFCIGIGAIGLIWSVILKQIPLEKILPGGGNKEITPAELEKMSTMNLKKKHDSKFYRNQSGIIKSSGVIEDRRID